MNPAPTCDYKALTKMGIQLATTEVQITNSFPLLQVWRARWACLDLPVLLALTVPLARRERRDLSGLLVGCCDLPTSLPSTCVSWLETVGPGVQQPEMR